LVVRLLRPGSLGLYIVRANEVALNPCRKVTAGSQAGLNYNWPAPIGQVNQRCGDRNIKLTQAQYRRRRSGRSTPISGRETLMLTGDANIIDISFDVQWQVDASRSSISCYLEPGGDGPGGAESPCARWSASASCSHHNDRGPLAADAQKCIQDIAERLRRAASIS